MTIKLPPARSAFIPVDAAIFALRQDLHAHPELAHKEVRAAEEISMNLTNWVIEVHRGLAETGGVGCLKVGRSEKAIGLRAVKDALPIEEQDNITLTSRHSGRMHACGHDAHTAMLLTAEQHLAGNRSFDATIYFIFQPAEEAGSGGRRMLEDGQFEKFPMDAVFRMHNWRGYPAGHFAVRAKADDGIGMRVSY
jgi:amidohydrolase